MFLRILLVSALVLCSSANLIAKEQPLSFDAELSNYQYDLPVQFFNFSSQNTPLKMAYSYLKPSNNMPTVILMHGKNFNGHYWTNTANYLNSKGYGIWTETIRPRLSEMWSEAE